MPAWLAKDKFNHPIQALKPGTNQVVSFDGSTATTNALSADTVVVRLVSTQDCYIAFGSSPTATSSDMLLPSGVAEYFRVDANSSTKIAAIKVSSTGILHVTEMT